MKTVIFALLTDLGVFALVWWHVGAGLPATFTPPDSLGKPVPFEHRHERYVNVAEVMVTLASASLVFVPSSRRSLYSHACVFALILLGLCMLYSIGFMALLTYFYERFLYDDQRYTPGKYGLLHGLGFGALRMAQQAQEASYRLLIPFTWLGYCGRTLTRDPPQTEFLCESDCYFCRSCF